MERLQKLEAPEPEPELEPEPQVLLVTKDNKALCGLRFRTQHGHSDGCLGLRRARATETKDTHGYYEALTCGA